MAGAVVGRRPTIFRAAPLRGRHEAAGIRRARLPGAPPRVEAARTDLRLERRPPDIIALATRGEDGVGNPILGEESLQRFFDRPADPLHRDRYPDLASGVLLGAPGSSAGGEHPKFLVDAGDRHLLVKFAGGEGAAADRWRDLLVAEHLAAEVLRAAGLSAARTSWFDLDGSRYLEVERFDRVGRRGRLGVISLYALNRHFLGGDFDDWSRAGRRIVAEPTLSLAEADARRITWLDTFGDLIGNTDRHFGNLSFFADDTSQPTLTLAPSYDMLPMVFAPAASNLVDRPYSPRSPDARNLEAWHEVAAQAGQYWEVVEQGAGGGLSDDFRRTAGDCRARLAQLVARCS